MFAVSAARADDSLEVKRWKERSEKSLQLSIDAANKKCGATITGRFDWSATKYDDFGTKLSAPRYQVAPNAVEAACATGDDAKAAVRKAIKTIVIKPSAGAQSKLELKAGELDLIVVPDHNVMREDAKAWVLKRL
ncbi:MAG TPA: hypothetical protein VH165_06605 [Kofleriaceae bacterium]|nr:hypothetical protein [Kofleriaceae bacterium]